MARRNFVKWFNTFRASINSYKYYVDFEKIYANVDKLKTEICILYSLIGSKDIETDFRNLVTEYPKCLKAIPLLLAVRNKEIFCKDDNGEVIYHFDHPVETLDQYVYFMRETGLFDMLQRPNRSSLYDYVTGIETGLDTHARKDRSGKEMEKLVEGFIEETGREYYRQMTLKQVALKWKMDLSAISTNKKFDFVIKTDSCVYAMEVNFYNTSGSKPNETSRSYTKIAAEAENIKNFKFIWVTDGGGWCKSQNVLIEAFNVVEHLYNIADLEGGVLKKVLK